MGLKDLLTLILLALLLNGCYSINQVDIKTGLGNEVRYHEDTEHRYSGMIGPVVKMKDGSSFSVTYRNRMTNWQESTMEHGVFLGAQIPIWRNK